MDTANGPAEAVHRVSFELQRGGAIGLVGESGSGKTLTCRAILGVLPSGCAVSDGSIELDGIELVGLDRRGWSALRALRIGGVFQDPASYLNPSLPVGKQLAEVLRIRGGLQRREARSSAVELLALMRLRNPSRVYHQLPAELSGGMLQRVLIATAVSCEPDVLVADEATTALDLTTQREVIDLLLMLRAELGLAVVFVSHDLAAVAELCDDVAVFYAGQIVETGSTEDVVGGPTHPYTEALLRVAAIGPSLDVIPGHHPRLGEQSTGCRFAPRCVHASRSCVEKRIPLTGLEAGRAVRCLRAAELSLPGTEVR